MHRDTPETQKPALKDLYALHRSLHRGTPSRCGLPPEVVQIVFRFAVITRPSRDLGWSWDCGRTEKVVTQETAGQQEEDKGSQDGREEGEDDEEEVVDDDTDNDDDNDDNDESDGSENEEDDGWEDDEEHDYNDDETSTSDDEPRAVSIYAHSATLVGCLILQSPVLTKPMLLKIASLRVETLSKDQGWCSSPGKGAWSWFEMGLVGEPFEDVLFSRIPKERRFHPKVDKDEDKTLAWVSHCNDIAGKGFKRYLSDEEWGPSHEIWQHLGEGDRIGVWMCAQFGGWGCNSREVRIKVREWFEPSFL